MGYEIIIKPYAKLDLSEAVRWYKEKDLALDFINEVSDSLETIKNNPYLFQKRFQEIRVVFTHRFPYGIHYTVEEEIIFVHAVFHMKRKPR